MSKQDDPSTQSLADKIARLSIDTYLQLPAKCKPVIRSNGVPEWTILAAIVLAIPTSHAPISSLKATASDDSASAPQYDLQLVSLGTGMKCLPYNRLPPAGDTLHDQHAEVLAKRGFRRWLLDQAQEMKERAEVGEDMDGGVLQVSVDGEIGLRDGVQVWLYVSTLPCGDASTTYTAAYQPIDMANLKSQPPVHPSPSSSESSTTTTSLPSSRLDGPQSNSIPFSSTGPSVPPSSARPLDQDTAQTLMRGRNDYTRTSALRTKPGRPDSFPSISLSCSDKICSWSVLGLQGALLNNVRIGVSVPLRMPDGSSGSASVAAESLPDSDTDTRQVQTSMRVRQQWRFSPMYLHGMVIGDVLPPRPETEGRLVGWSVPSGTSVATAEGVDDAGHGREEKVRSFRSAVRADAEWALYGRVQSIAAYLPAPWRATRPLISFTSVPFPYSKLALSAAPATPPTSIDPCTRDVEMKDPAPMMNSLLHLPAASCSYRTHPEPSTRSGTSTGAGLTEVLYQGADARQPWKPPGLVPLPHKRRSRMCKLEMMRGVSRLAGVEMGSDEEKGRTGRRAGGKGSSGAGDGAGGGAGRGIEAGVRQGEGARVAAKRRERAMELEADMADISLIDRKCDKGEDIESEGDRGEEKDSHGRITYRQLKQSTFSSSSSSLSVAPQALLGAASVSTSTSSTSPSDNPSASIAPLTYLELGHPSTYQAAKRLLRGSSGPPGLVSGFERCGPLSVTCQKPYKAETAVEVHCRPGAPFVGWIATGAEWEAFDMAGRVASSAV